MSKYFMRIFILTMLLAVNAGPQSPTTGQSPFRLADCTNLGFSVEEDFATQGPLPADGNPIISDGDLLGPYGRICARNQQLLAAFAARAALQDLGLDAADIISIKGNLVAFSTEVDDPQGRFTAGDLLTTWGITISNAVLLTNFVVQGDVGLDGIHIVGDTQRIIAFFDAVQERQETDNGIQILDALPEMLRRSRIDFWFSTEGGGMTANGQVFLDGDLLSAANGTIVLANNHLLAPPIPAGIPNRGVDLGLDAISANRQGLRTTLRLSTELRYQDQSASFTDGDVLALGGIVLTTNWDLIRPFEPKARMIGLDALTYPNLVRPFDTMSFTNQVYLPIVLKNVR